MEETEIFNELEGELSQTLKGEFSDELKEEISNKEVTKLSEEIKELGREFKEGGKTSEKRVNKALPLFKTFREVEYIPEPCKECKSLDLTRKKGIEAKVIGLRLESPIGLFILEGCNLKLLCAYKKKTFVLKCLPIDINGVIDVIADLEDWLYGIHREIDDSYFWEKFSVDEEGLQFAKEIIKKVLLFGEEEKAMKALESFPFPAHFNEVFEAFAEVSPYGTLVFPYMASILCTVKADESIKTEEETGVIKTEEELEEFFYKFFTRPYENIDTCFMEMRGKEHEIGICYCIAKRHHAISFGSVKIEFFERINKESGKGPIQMLYGLTHAPLINAMGDILYAILTTGQSKENIYKVLNELYQKYL